MGAGRRSSAATSSPFKHTLTMTRFRRLVPLFLFGGFCLVVLAPQLFAQSNNRAALVVRLDDGDVHTQCVDFPEPQIDGYELLLRSGLPVAAEVQGMGSLICSIDGVGCGADDCLCQCRGGGDCVYWSYWLRQGGGWQYSQAGASQVPVSDGAIQGWSWGPGAANVAIPPPNLSFGDVCQETVVETPTSTPIPPTATPEPSATPTATATRPPEVDFSVDATQLDAGGCTTLRWRVANITAVFLNEIGVVGEDAQQVCPAQTQTFTLRIIHPEGEETRALTVTVLEPSATSPAPTAPSAPTAAQVAAVVASPLPPTNTPPPTATTARVDDSPPPAPTSPSAATATAVASPTILWVTVPPLPTTAPAAVVAALPETVVPTPEAIAEAPVATGAIVEAAATTAAPSSNWLSYLVFAIIAVTLALLVWRASRRSPAS